MTKALHRHSLDAEFPVAVKGDGMYFVDAEGKRYIDGSGGAAVSCLGHGNARVREAVKAQIDALEFAHTRFFSNEPMEALAKDLVSDAPAGLTKAWFTCGGSESIEAALKITRQYFIETGQPQRRHVIGRQQSYHGATAGALSAGGVGVGPDDAHLLHEPAAGAGRRGPAARPLPRPHRRRPRLRRHAAALHHPPAALA